FGERVGFALLVAFESTLFDADLTAFFARAAFGGGAPFFGVSERGRELRVRVAFGLCCGIGGGALAFLACGGGELGGDLRDLSTDFLMQMVGQRRERLLKLVVSCHRSWAWIRRSNGMGAFGLCGCGPGEVKHSTLTTPTDRV